MVTKLNDTNKAIVFTVLATFMALTAGLTLNLLNVTSELLGAGLYMLTPALATLLMLLLVTRDGLSREGWRSLGLHRLGLKAWWIALLSPLAVGVVAAALVWATPFASFSAPKDGLLDAVLNFLVGVVLSTLTFSLGEELGWRGYLLPRRLSMGRTRALVLVGLVWSLWHMPLIFLTPVYHAGGNKFVVLPLFVGTLLAASFFIGYLRLWTGSVWPATIAHSAHNAAWGALGTFTLTSKPVAVEEYLSGDSGIFVLVGTTLAAVWLANKLRNRLDHPHDNAPAETDSSGDDRSPYETLRV
jgi:CAAX protease family protein